MNESKRRKLIAALTVGLVIGGAVAAYAYFTSTGSGTGTATVGTATAFDVDVSVDTDTLYPGQGSNGITVTVTNDGQGNQLLDQIVATVVAPTNTGSNGSIPACTAADFALSGGSWVISGGGTIATLSDIGEDLVPNDSYTDATLSVSMNDLNQNQNNCQNATVNLSFDAS